MVKITSLRDAKPKPFSCKTPEQRRLAVEKLRSGEDMGDRVSGGSRGENTCGGTRKQKHDRREARLMRTLIVRHSGVQSVQRSLLAAMQFAGMGDAVVQVGQPYAAFSVSSALDPDISVIPEVFYWDRPSGSAAMLHKTRRP